MTLKNMRFMINIMDYTDDLNNQLTELFNLGKLKSIIGPTFQEVCKEVDGAQNAVEPPILLVNVTVSWCPGHLLLHCILV